jgi:hypothetical protein
MTQATSERNFAIIESDKGVVFLYADGTISCDVTKSTSINYWTWSANNVLSVNFVQTPEKYYHYKGVPYSTVVGLLMTKSVGSFVAREIKPNYELL